MATGGRHVGDPGRDERSPVARARGKLQRKEGIRAEEVLETALALFSQESYADVTVQDIAKRVGVTHSLIYYYFESKEKLFQAAILHVLDRVMEQYSRVTAQHDDPVDLLDDWFETNVKLAGPLRSVVRIMFEYSEAGGRRASPSVERVIRQFYDFERQTITDGIKARRRARALPLQRSGAAGGLRLALHRRDLLWPHRAQGRRHPGRDGPAARDALAAAGV